MKLPLFFSFLFSLAVSVVSIPVLTKLARYFNFFDHPGERRVHKVPISRVGGIAIVIGAQVPILFWLPMERVLSAYMIGTLLIFSMGIWDDLVNIHFKVKFTVQFLASLIVVFLGGIILERIPLPSEILTTECLMILTIIFFIGVTNAVNFSDGLDGLAGGLSFVSLGGFAFLGYLEGDVLMAIVAMSIMGGVYGFLRYNAYPASVFMGDGGSQFLGFSLCTLATLLTQTSRGGYPFGISLLILGLPVLDTVGVMIQRCLDRRIPFLPDNKHIHHKLLTIGLSHKEAVILIYFVQSVMVLVAVLVRSKEEWVIWGTYAFFVIPLLILFFLSGLDLLSWFRLKRDPVRLLLRAIDPLIKRHPWLKERPLQLLQGSLFLFMTVSVSIPFDVTPDIRISALVLFVLVLLGMTLMQRAAPFLIRLSLYIGSTFVIYLNAHIPLSVLPRTQQSVNIFFVLVTLLVIVNAVIEFGRNQPFQVTSLDYLIVIVIVAAAFFEIEVAGIKVGLFAAKLAVIFVAFELILNRFSGRIYRFGFVILWVLLVIGVRGWIY